MGEPSLQPASPRSEATNQPIEDNLVPTPARDITTLAWARAILRSGTGPSRGKSLGVT